MKFAVFLRCTPARAAAALFFLLVGSLGQRATAQTCVYGSACNPSSVNNIVYVDGATYPSTIAGIQSAATAAGAFANGGKVIVPTGTYQGTTTLAIPSNVTVECDGWDAILQWTSGLGSATAVTLANTSVLRNCKLDESAEALTASISNITISMGTATATCSAACGFTAGNIVNIAGNSQGALNTGWVVATDSGVHFTFSTAVPSGGSGGTARQASTYEIQVNGPTALVEHNWVVGQAADSDSSYKIGLQGTLTAPPLSCSSILSQPTSQDNQYDDISFVLFRCTDAARSIGDAFLNYRTGLWADASTNFQFSNTQCLTVAGTGLINGFDCILINGSQRWEVVAPVVEASREHGIYVGGLSVGSTPNLYGKIIGGSYAHFAGSAVKVHASSGLSANQIFDIQVIGIAADTCSTPAGAQVSCVGVTADQAVGVKVLGGTFRNLGRGIDLQGLLDTVDVSGITAQSNQYDGIRLEGAGGALHRISVHDNLLASNNQCQNDLSCTARGNNFSGITLDPDGGFANSTLTFDNNECDDTQATPTQDYCVQFDGPSGSVTGTNAYFNRGSGNVNGNLSSIPAAYTSTAILPASNQSGSGNYCMTANCALTAPTIGGGSALTIYHQVSSAITPVSVSTGVCAEQTFHPAAFGVLGVGEIPNVSSASAYVTMVFPVNYRISAAGTLAITYCNPTGSALTPTASTITVTTFH